MSYFKTVGAASADWTKETNITACGDIGYSKLAVETDASFTAAYASFQENVIKSVAAPTEKNTSGKYAYNSDTSIDGDWMTLKTAAVGADKNDAAKWGKTVFPIGFNFLQGTSSSTDTGDSFANVIGLGPTPTGDKITDGQKSANMLYNLMNDGSITNQTVNFSSASITLGSLAFNNVDTDAIVAMSSTATNSEALNWTWVQADPTKFTISYNDLELAVDADKKKASVTVGNGKYTLLPLAYYTKLSEAWT